jgi:hypothetical protein
MRFLSRVGETPLILEKIAETSLVMRILGCGDRGRVRRHRRPYVAATFGQEPSREAAHRRDSRR